MGVDTDVVKAHVRPRCFMDVAVDNILLGRIVFELFDDFCPLTCENFRALCTGEKGLGKNTGKPLHFQGVIFHRVVKSFMVQTGDFSAGNGTGGESIFGGTFPDENFDLKHDQPFLLSMANRGPDTNGSQFFITTQPTPHLDGVHVVFGRVVSGQPVVMQIEELGVDKNSRPLQDAKVVKCGELVLKSKIKQVEDHAIDSESTSESDNDKKHRRKKKKEKESKKKDGKNFSKSSRTKEENSENEESDGQLHPLASVTNIDPEEIPSGPPNRFLSRGGPSSMYPVKPQRDYNDRQKKKNRIRGVTKSGRVVKGRGTLRFRTPSRSRSRSYTPPHWRQEQKKIITYNEFEKLEIERKEREEEIKRREEARKKRHEEREKREKGNGGETPPGTPPKENDKEDIDMMAKIEDVFQIIRDRNVKNDRGISSYDSKKIGQRNYDSKKKNERDEKNRYSNKKIDKRENDRRSRSRSPRRRFDNNYRRDTGGPRANNRFHQDNRYNNRHGQGGNRNRSKDREQNNRKRKNSRRSNSSSSSSENDKNKNNLKNKDNFSLSPEVKD